MLDVKPEYVALYTDFLKKHFHLARPLTIVADASNGCAGIVIKELTGIPNVNIILINDDINPEFPAHGPNPLLPGATDQAAAKVKETKADLGVIFDADADRAFFVDENGKKLDSYLISILLFKHFQPPFVADEPVYMSLSHMNLFKKEDLFPSRIGTRFIKEKLKEINASTAAEFSGHYYFKDFFGTDSGIFTMIQILNSLSTMNETLSAFCATLPSQIIKNDDIKLAQEKSVSAVIENIKSHYQATGIKIESREGITLDFGDKWINIRSSNTEPVIRLICGSKSEPQCTALINDIKALL
jgi:phosphomannomutase